MSLTFTPLLTWIILLCLKDLSYSDTPKKANWKLGAAAAAAIVVWSLPLLWYDDAPSARTQPRDVSTVKSNVALSDASITSAGGLTGPQNNAVRSAKQYLRLKGFSRNALIRQLSSDAGDGYELSDAAVAVDSLNVDWNLEAVRSAKEYLRLKGFSCKGLIHQLSSSAGGQFTESQATYGAEQAGAC